MISENLFNLGKETDIQVPKAQSVQNKMNSKRPTPRQTLIKMAEVKDRVNLKGIKKTSCIQGKPRKAIS